MGTLSLNLPLPVLNGAGAGVDCSTLGAPRTITCQGELAGAVIAIEVSTDAGVSYTPLYAFNGPTEVVIPVAAQYMRTNVSGRGSKPWLTFAVNVDVGAPDSGSTFGQLAMPVGNGGGAALDISAFENFNTFVCTGEFPGASVAIQISEEAVPGADDWSTIGAFYGRGGVLNRVVSAHWARAFVAGRGDTFTAVLGVGTTDLGGGGGGGGSGVDLENAGVPLAGGPFSTLDLIGITASDSGGGVAQLVNNASVVTWKVGDTWATAYAQLQAITGPKICLVEYDPTGDRAMTARAGDPTDLNEVIFLGTSCATRQDGEGVTIAVEDGFRLAATTAPTGLERCSLQSQWITWDFTALTTPAFTTGVNQRVVYTQLGGQLKPSNTASVFAGTVAVALTNVVMAVGANFVTTDLDTCVIEAQGRTSFYGWTSTAGNQIAIFTDASCQWFPSQFVAAGFVIAGNVEVFNFAPNATGASLYAISVDGGGNVVATLVP